MLTHSVYACFLIRQFRTKNAYYGLPSHYATRQIKLELSPYPFFPEFVGIPAQALLACEMPESATMKTVAITGKKQCRLLRVPRPTAKGGFVVVKVMSAPLCTEYSDYADGCARAEYQRGDESPSCLGHEAAGEVVEAAQPGKVKVGDRVVVMPGFWCGKCRYCQSGEYIHCLNPVDPHAACDCETGAAAYAEYCLKQDWLLLPIPDDMSYDHAAMACCGLGPAWNAMQTLNVGADDTVLISGLGPVGLGTVVNAVYRGARVIGLARNPYRSKLALALGAEAVLNPEDDDILHQIHALTDGEGPSASIETSGQTSYMGLLMNATRRKGHLAFIGESGDFPIAISDQMIRKGLNLHGIWHWNLHEADAMLKMISEVGPSLDLMITHRFPFSEIEKAWELQITGASGKVIIHPDS
jgi:L-iditol 2-dehydrogenase